MKDSGPCLAQSGWQRTGQGRLSPPVSHLFRLRIGRSSHEFFDEGHDHEIESTVKCAFGWPVLSVEIPSNYLNLNNKNSGCDFFVPRRRGVAFCTGNNSKDLAFCAARSHIVAVR
jgi:hypothetical protein